MASAGSRRLCQWKQAAVWSDVTSLPSIIAGSVGGGGTGSRRETEGDRVSDSEEDTHTQYTTLSAAHMHTHLHTGSQPKVTAIICSEAGR